MNWWRKFKESTFQQVTAILLVVAVVVFVCFTKIPALKVYTYSWKLSWDQAYVPVEVLDEMMLVKHYGVLDVLIHNFNDGRKVKQSALEAREDFWNDGGETVGDYCVYLFITHTEYNQYGEIPLRYKMPKNDYDWSSILESVKHWYADSKKTLVWDSTQELFYDTRN